jgi:hypothetical protein
MRLLDGGESLDGGSGIEGEDGAWTIRAKPE